MSNKALNKRRVLVYDSGIGGLTVLKEARSLCPGLDYIYFADYKNMPFGNKPLLNLRKSIVQTITDLATRLRVGVIILACNTATSVAIEQLRQKLPNLEIIGTEPALKLACDLGYERIALLATSNTIKYNRVVRNFVSSLGDKLILFPLNSLATDIEENLHNNRALISCVTSLAQKIKKFEPDCVVLGCTHYVMLKKSLFENIGVTILDGNGGVAKRLNSLVCNTNSVGKIMISTNDFSRLKNLKRAFEFMK